jgi:hypothetical protein
LPFQVVDSQIVWQELSLRPDSSAFHYGKLSGTVADSSGGGVNGVLIIAMRASDSLSFSASTGLNGFYEFYNLPPGDYVVTSYMAKYESLDSANVHIESDGDVKNVNLTVRAFSGNTLTGHITNRAVVQRAADVTLVNPITREAIPGLQTFHDPAGGTYTLTDIPPGTYITWASYRNDGLVVDPDYVFKFGLPVLTFTSSDTLITADFSLTDAVTIVSPTNEPDSIYPVAIVDTIPTFVWRLYPSTKEYIVVVYDSRGDRVWGGYDAAGTVLHPQIGARDTSCVFNFDSSAVSSLKRGRVYRWKVFADFGAEPNIQKLISASEDLLGLFYIPTEAD